MWIGFYNYTVIVTYIGLFSSVFGITQAMSGRFRTALACLAFSGLCDMFDGKIARTKKDRTDDEKLFGIQIDSLCDVVCFGVFPVLIFYLLGVRGIPGGIVLAFYAMCSVTRLAFFNVLETNRQREESGCNTYYHGLPITSISVIFPLVFTLNFVIPKEAFIILLYITAFVVGLLFILNFKFRKPTNKELCALVFVVGIAVFFVVFFSDYHVSKITFPERALGHFLFK